MSFAPRRPPRPSRKLPRELEDEIRAYVFDQGDYADNDDPQLIIGNSQSGCFGLYFVTPEGILFIFHHATMKYATTCNCLVKGEPGSKTMQIPDELNRHRLQLITSGPPRMEPKLAAIVVMKLFLGLEVPEQFRVESQEETETADSGQEAELEEQNDQSKTSELEERDARESAGA